MKALLDATERWRLVPRIAIAIAAFLLLAGLGVIFNSDRSYRQQKADEASAQAAILAASVSAALDFKDRATVKEYVDALAANPQIEAAAVYDAEGRMVASYGRSGSRVPERQPPQASRTIDEDVTIVVPVRWDGSTLGAVYMRSDIDPVSRRFTRYSIIALLIVMAALVVIVLGVAHAALRRASLALVDRASALVEANRQLQVQMEERAKAEEALRQAQKMQALGQLTGGIAHDFNNLLTVIQGSADLLKRPGLSEEKRTRFAEAIAETAARAAALTSQLLAFARRQPLRPKLIDLNAHVRAMAHMLEQALGARIAIRSDLAPGLPAIEVDPTQLEVAILNIAVNARDAMPNGGTLAIRTGFAPAHDDAPPIVALTISDTGSGIDEETLGRVFEPFFTTKGVGKGTGLGLSQVYGFAAQSGGEVRIESKLGEGTAVTLLLPSAELRPSEEAPPEAALPRAAPSATVLLVEDNAEVGAFAESLLAELQYRVLRAENGEQALSILDGGAEVDIVFTDVIMPGISGIELAAAIRTRRPDLPVVLTTGYSGEIADTGAGDLAVVLKPYRLEVLAATLEEALGRSR